MLEIDRKILVIDKIICSNINSYNGENRGFLSQNILSQVRNFVEHISIKIYASRKNSDNNEIEINQANIKEATNYIKSKGNYKFLSKFHYLLQKSASHYTLEEENSERLMLKYYEYLLRIKGFLFETHQLEVLSNIDKFPLSNDPNLYEYYLRISKEINSLVMKNLNRRFEGQTTETYYIQKIKPFFINQKIYYEITFNRANDNQNKHDRFIAFTELDIQGNYSVRLTTMPSSIEILDKTMPILIITNWEVSIRPCEIRNFAKILDLKLNITRASKDYINLMEHLTSSGLNLLELILLTEKYYLKTTDHLTSNLDKKPIFHMLDKCRNIVLKHKDGSNILRYLLLNLNNRIIKGQYQDKYYSTYHEEYRPHKCSELSDLCLKYGCIPFDTMPFNSALINHNPKFIDVFVSIDSDGREHELFGRLIKNNSENHSSMYTFEEDIVEFDEDILDNLVEKYNSFIYKGHLNRKIEKYKGHFYIKDYVEDAIYIINTLCKFNIVGIKNYRSFATTWVDVQEHNIDCGEKKEVIKTIFGNSQVAFIYGAAGTGKTTLINHISNLFYDKQKLYLANTNPAVDNLKRKVTSPNCEFSTIASFLYSKSSSGCDILIIDECSTVSNRDMRKVLGKAEFRALILVGDVYQIESIIFGNWFNIIKEFVSKSSVFELTKPYRSNDKNLLMLWDRVRKVDDSILELITKQNYSIKLDESIFEYTEADEIILCLNYDGLYGINNINRFLQSSNENPALIWDLQSFKVHDPILFLENERFHSLLYNNLKGRILKIEKKEYKITFEIEVDKVFSGLDVSGFDVELLDSLNTNKSTIRFSVDKYDNADDDENDSSSSVIPFQIAYAVSIHKAQGIEYDSVKVVINNEIEELITHNIFYTAITRAKKQLKIYWTPETEKKVLESFKLKNYAKDVGLITSQINDK